MTVVDLIGSVLLPHLGGLGIGDADAISRYLDVFGYSDRLPSVSTRVSIGKRRSATSRANPGRNGWPGKTIRPAPRWQNGIWLRSKVLEHQLVLEDREWN